MIDLEEIETFYAQGYLSRAEHDREYAYQLHERAPVEPCGTPEAALAYLSTVCGNRGLLWHNVAWIQANEVDEETRFYRPGSLMPYPLAGLCGPCYFVLKCVSLDGRAGDTIAVATFTRPRRLEAAA